MNFRIFTKDNMFVLVDVATSKQQYFVFKYIIYSFISVFKDSQFGLREDVPLYIGERKNAATSHLFCNHTECIKCAKVVVKVRNLQFCRLLLMKMLFFYRIAMLT